MERWGKKSVEVGAGVLWCFSFCFLGKGFCGGVGGLVMGVRVEVKGGHIL